MNRATNPPTHQVEKNDSQSLNWNTVFESAQDSAPISKIHKSESHAPRKVVEKDDTQVLEVATIPKKRSRLPHFEVAILEPTEVGKAIS